MKRVTFTKAVKIRPSCWPVISRPDYPGYLLTHTNHPGREFVIARASRQPKSGSKKFVFVDTWRMYDRKSGFHIATKVVKRTRGECVSAAVEFLSLHTPEMIQEVIERMHAKRLGGIIAS